MEFLNNVTNSTSTYHSMSSTVPPDHPQAYLGFIALSVSILFFGSNYLPVKQFETGDGMFFQLILTTGIWSVGFIVYAIRNFPKFYALPMLGGFFWSTGNLSVVPIIKTIGIGLGVLFWNTILLIIGWAVARFGLLGVKPEVPSNQTLNYIGVVMCGLSGVFYLFVSSDSHSPRDAERQPLLAEQPNVRGDEDEIVPIVVLSTNNTRDDLFVDRLSRSRKRVLGITLSCLAGVLYGFTFTPALYVQDNYPDASANALDYVFSLYTGIYLSAVFYFALYCALMKNSPKVYPRVILPALISGLMWGCANSSFFFANNSLTQAITFPIISSGPSAVSALWGIILYNEIKGLPNFLILGVGFAFAIAGSVLCGISK